MIIRTYKELIFFINMFKNSNSELLIVESRGGCGKSRIVEEHMQNMPHAIVHSHITPMQLYILGYKYRDLPLIFDDVDGLLYNKQTMALLKMFCETRDTKTIGWYSTSNILKSQKIPQTYKTKSKVLILTNNFQALSKKVGALQDRGWLIEFKPTDEELLKKMEDIKIYYKNKLTKKEINKVYNLIKKHSKDGDFSLRTFVKGVSLYKQCKIIEDSSWEKNLLSDMNINPKVVLFNGIMTKYNSDKERVTIWEKEGFSKRSFYYYKSGWKAKGVKK